MSINPVSTAAPASVASAPVSKPQVADSKPQAAAAAVKVVSAAVQEASETPAQTLKEAASGDHQAQKLLHHGSNPGGLVNTKA